MLTFLRFCVDSDGEDVPVQAEGAETEEDHDHESESEEEHDHESETEHDHESESEAESSSENQHCHFHAGVEHCTGSESESAESESTCEAPSRDFNIGLRVGLLFVILATSSIGVFGPILLFRMMPTKLNLIFIVLKQFGTGIIVSTAFVHLFTHAFLMFSNECMGELTYEATTAAIVMAGIFLSFLVEFIGQRIVLAKVKSSAALSQTQKANSFLSTEVVSILVMEAGIIFHSLLIGLTLVVSGDEYFITLFVVILFHQMFEGIALGSRIATIGTTADAHVVPEAQSSRETVTQNSDKAVTPSDSASSDDVIVVPVGLSTKKKLGLATLFAFITPIGMAIGIGVLQQFNGSNRSTLIAIGTLDALSAGILIWVGLVEMWAADWMVGPHGKQAELADADILTTTLAGFGLIAGLAIMSLLGKWA
ncbi:high-affinity Zn(2+) transporter zrt1 [Neonectria magnoliae]|uniref:High-affinity Zn(2+) transporter zrt1 n=1 Tax=Neonectria magnoliae TaxID=2732573 RepID=A0ABR1IDB6_9HYPO